MSRPASLVRPAAAMLDPKTTAAPATLARCNAEECTRRISCAHRRARDVSADPTVEPNARGGEACPHYVSTLQYAGFLRPWSPS